jgi:hypothetical protein
MAEDIFFESSEVGCNQTMVQIQQLSGDCFEVNVGERVMILGLKKAIAAHMGLSIFDFGLIAKGEEAPARDSRLVCMCQLSNIDKMTMVRTVKMTVVKSLFTLQSHEEKSHAEWLEIAHKLQDRNVNDDTALVHLRAFLDKYPALINWQVEATNLGQKTIKPLLSHAVENCLDTQLRQQCVDELLNRGARVNIRHWRGFLIDSARVTNSAFVSYLEAKREDFKAYEKKAISAWRDVSSKLCGECAKADRVYDEAEMRSIVAKFCTEFPEMVNFQNNHVCARKTDEPRGYFGYATLMTFAGLRACSACRVRTGRSEDDADVRKASVEELLKHGARVDVFHGGKSCLEWMEEEGSPLVGSLKDRLESPVPPQESFSFQAISREPCAHGDADRRPRAALRDSDGGTRCRGAAAQHVFDAVYACFKRTTAHGGVNQQVRKCSPSGPSPASEMMNLFCMLSQAPFSHKSGVA